MTAPLSTVGTPMTPPDPRWEALERAAHYMIRRLWLSQPDGGPFVTIVGEFARFKQLQGAMQRLELFLRERNPGSVLTPNRTIADRCRQRLVECQVITPSGHKRFLYARQSNDKESVVSLKTLDLEVVLLCAPDNIGHLTPYYPATLLPPHAHTKIFPLRKKTDFKTTSVFEHEQ
ncbi:hypothetical protein BJX68DRAFT_270815 [Aspergillus pseudodeflectus]|uniref:Uncharacterized protein n=1 Tax=Aspergillus pseudodeflectus TaxID=176178 RepID=A0ABR4JSN1_9EURO